ncbi:hypothetical protein A2634_01175 [Candidatus Amesbacteria bacterium RIFCSPHIGHO2_01_FULL_48_32]|uniref:Uncharacterized protein n=1 Tax=Candidatus Amesbacteria bacterium RIFCSPLOWO2_01_FULL_48_25 TaxID=1797259 RepID=A0A1F4ZBK9_9BACT|nr:MAG: hypothetical protein A2634_01175 [Candidatus Amesbacteria bacterium RIFCSPHIGHO2_01_FULL_48_32]OGD03653.1 MAG: hypothetical protein A2989_03160 [Candidatus Amesbacteria bacterium RIFCSPLOWO2_01_FULL_48_25]HJZ06000.1 hypothetical protein [Patescibacteria group bacterium]
MTSGEWCKRKYRNSELSLGARIKLGLLALALACGYGLYKLGPDNCNHAAMYGDMCPPATSQSR